MTMTTMTMQGLPSSVTGFGKGEECEITGWPAGAGYWRGPNRSGTSGVDRGVLSTAERDGPGLNSLNWAWDFSD